MDYKNPQNVRFKVYNSSQDRYVVKYYPGVSQWPRALRSFHCPTEETRQEMFFLIGNMRLCNVCQVSLLGHLDDPNKVTCQECILKAAASIGILGEDIPECPVCYQKMLAVDGSRKTLACRHQVCGACATRMSKPAGYWHGCPTRTITCPLCRDCSVYDIAFRPIVANTGA